MMHPWTLLLAGLLVSGGATADRTLGRIGDQPFQLGDLSLREQIQLHEEAGRLEQRWRQAGERYAFERLLAEHAKAAGQGKDDYVETLVPVGNIAITEEQVDRYLAQNPQVARRFQGTPEVLRLRVRQALMEQEKEQRLAVLRQSWFAEADVQFEPLFGGIPAPRLTVPRDPRDQTLGPAGAPLDVVVFLDLECPYCRRLFPMLIELQQRFPDQVRLVFKHLPLPIHPRAAVWAAAAECAARQGRFVDFLREVYGQGSVGRGPGEVAQTLELETPAFDACLTEDEAAKEKVSDDAHLAAELGITTTPTLIIGDEPLIGQKGVGELQAIVNGKLAALRAGESPDRP